MNGPKVSGMVEQMREHGTACFYASAGMASISLLAVCILSVKTYRGHYHMQESVQLVSS